MRLATLGGFPLDVVTDEKVTRSSELTSHPIESGAYVSDHIRSSPEEMSISGAFAGNKAWNRMRPIQKLYNDKAVVNYVGRNIFNSVVITSLDTSHPASNRLGLEFSITLKKVRMATSRRFGDSAVGEKLQTQVARKMNAGTQQVMIR